MEKIAVRTVHYYKTYQMLLFVLVTSALFLSVTLPLQASADTISTQTQQVLPPGSNTCAPVSATNFTPYIYDGALHSFEFSLPDPSYVALLGTAGNTSIPFNLMTRKVDASGVLRIHVDTPSILVVGTLPIQVTLMSARSGQPVCVALVAMSTGSGPVAPGNNPPSYVPPTTGTPSTPPYVPPTVPPTTGGTPAPGTGSTGGGSVSTGKTGTGKQSVPPPVSTTSTTSTSTATTVPVVGVTQNPLKNICASDTSAYRLWLILLVLYALVVGALLWAEFPMSLPWSRTPERIAAIILILLLLLLGFWYFSISCRAALWMPLVAFLVAVLGLLAAFWNHPRVTKMLLVQETPKKL